MGGFWALAIHQNHVQNFVWGIPGAHPRAMAGSVPAAASGGSDVQPGGESLMGAGGRD